MKDTAPVRIMVTFLLCSIGLITTGCDCTDTVHEEYTVRYSVTGSTTVSGIYYLDTDGSHSLEDVSLPWSRTFTATGGRLLDLWAWQNDYTDITCGIYINSSLRETRTSYYPILRVNVADDEFTKEVPASCF